MEPRSVQLLGALPPSATQFYQIRAILTAVNQELNRVSSLIFAAEEDLSLLHAQTRLHLWERDLGIKEQQGGDTMARRRNILAKAKLRSTQREDSLEKALRTYLEQGDELSVEYRNQSYQFAATVRRDEAVLTTVSDMALFLHTTVPAHIAVALSASSHLTPTPRQSTLSSGQYTISIPIGE